MLCLLVDAKAISAILSAGHDRHSSSDSTIIHRCLLCFVRVPNAACDTVVDAQNNSPPTKHQQQLL